MKIELDIDELLTIEKPYLSEIVKVKIDETIICSINIHDLLKGDFSKLKINNDISSYRTVQYMDFLEIPINTILQNITIDYIISFLNTAIEPMRESIDKDIKMKEIIEKGYDIVASNTQDKELEDVKNELISLITEKMKHDYDTFTTRSIKGRY